MNEILALLKENNALLKEIKELLLLQMIDTTDYAITQDFRAFCINVAADIFVDMMKDNNEFKEKVVNHFKNSFK